jgi:carbon storage regulator CsrA
MLVLSRKVDERIQVGENISITVVQVRGNTVRLAIEAPKDVRILRAELEGKPAKMPAKLAVESKVASSSNNLSLHSEAEAISDSTAAASQGTADPAILAIYAEQERSNEGNRPTPIQVKRRYFSCIS